MFEELFDAAPHALRRLAGLAVQVTPSFYWDDHLALQLGEFQPPEALPLENVAEDGYSIPATVKFRLTKLMSSRPISVKTIELFAFGVRPVDQLPPVPHA